MKLRGQVSNWVHLVHCFVGCFECYTSDKAGLVSMLVTTLNLAILSDSAK